IPRILCPVPVSGGSPFPAGAPRSRHRRGLFAANRRSRLAPRPARRTSPQPSEGERRLKAAARAYCGAGEGREGEGEWQRAGGAGRASGSRRQEYLIGHVKFLPEDVDTQ
ncbi:hypothetical protein EJB05_09786, partial [Eragrostis curvula]